MKNTIFGEWLDKEASGKKIRLVIEEMSEKSLWAAVGKAKLETEPEAGYTLEVSSGEPVWPWHSQEGDRAGTILWAFDSRVLFKSLKLEQFSQDSWIRRFRVEYTADGIQWELLTPSTLIDAAHRQPCRIRDCIRQLDSDFLPAAEGTGLFKHFYGDFLLRAVEQLGEDCPYPDWFEADYFLSASTRPFAFGGVYNPGDVANFDVLIASIFAPEIAIETQKIFVQQVERFGFVPGVMNPGIKDDRAFSLDYSSFNWMPFCYIDTFSWTRDRKYLEWFAEGCGKWAKWLIGNRDRNSDGWVEPGVNACRPADAGFKERMAGEKPCIAERCPEFWDYMGYHNSDMSAFQMAIYELGTDDAPVYVNGRHSGVRFDPETCSILVHYIDNQLFISFLAGFLVYALGLSGQGEDRAYFENQRDKFIRLVAEHCWDEKSGFYYDRDADTGELRDFVKHVGGFLPLLFGIPSPPQAERLVRHLTNPGEFWTEFPVPSLSLDSPDFRPDGYWSGRSWPSYNFIIVRGLLNYGYLDIADQLLERWVRQLKSCMDRQTAGNVEITAEEKAGYDARGVKVPDIDWIVPENWNPFTGEVHGSGGLVWGGLWIPAVIMRSFWPVGEHHVIVRPGRSFSMKWGERWDVRISGRCCWFNGRFYKMNEDRSYLIDERTGDMTLIKDGEADPNLLIYKLKLWE